MHFFYYCVAVCLSSIFCGSSFEPGLWFQFDLLLLLSLLLVENTTLLFRELFPHFSIIFFICLFALKRGNAAYLRSFTSDKRSHFKTFYALTVGSRQVAKHIIYIFWPIYVLYIHISVYLGFTRKQLTWKYFTENYRFNTCPLLSVNIVQEEANPCVTN